MCGIAGLLFKRKPDRGVLEKFAQAVEVFQGDRGPDDFGVSCVTDRLYFFHNRLAIIDPGRARQPMQDDRGVITYNGEVYNFQDLRIELEKRGVTFRGHSDTEVMLEAFSHFGIAASVKRFMGMFAFAVWDREQRTLTLVRDRLGIKPLYWANFAGLFLFGSELKALRAIRNWTPHINPSAVASFMRHNYIPTPHTIYEGVHKLEPGTILTLSWHGMPHINRYWNALDVARVGIANPLTGSDGELADQLEALLTDAVRRRMIADVPLGAFLSGGVDSSTIAALMQASHTKRVRTFSIGFDIDEFNEAPYAAAVAKHLGTEHTELTVTSRQALDVIPKLPDWFDEPFADSSQIPTQLVSAMTRRHVTVALSGDGGDELFAGYTRYHLATRFWRYLSLLPHSLRTGLAGGITSISADRWSQLLAFLPARVRPAQAGDKLYKFASVLGLNDADALYRRLVSHWDPATIVPRATETKGLLWDTSLAKQFPQQLDRMQLLDLETYLPDDILTKVDRASMTVGLEARVPLLDHRVVEFAWRLPRRTKIRGGTSKWLLRQILYRHVPQTLIERPKMGFGVPLGEWLRGPLRDWAENLLDAKRMRETGLLDTDLVRQTWEKHLSGLYNQQYPLWDVLMFQAWLERWGAGLS